MPGNFRPLRYRGPVACSESAQLLQEYGSTTSSPSTSTTGTAASIASIKQHIEAAMAVTYRPATTQQELVVFASAVGCVAVAVSGVTALAAAVTCTDVARPLQR